MGHLFILASLAPAAACRTGYRRPAQGHGRCDVV